MTYIQKKPGKLIPSGPQSWISPTKGFKEAILNVFREVKKNLAWK